MRVKTGINLRTSRLLWLYIAARHLESLRVFIAHLLKQQNLVLLQIMANKSPFISSLMFLNPDIYWSSFRSFLSTSSVLPKMTHQQNRQKAAVLLIKRISSF